MIRMRRAVVVAAKAPSLGKSRLALPEGVRRGLAVAFARDVVAAAQRTDGVDRVVLMTTDEDLGREMEVPTVVDPVPGDLNASLAAVAASLEADVVVALLADLPALRAEELAGAVAAGDRGPAYVADAEGIGTSCYLAAPGSFTPAFGPGSAAAHATGGARALDGYWPGLRADVDDLRGLERALSLGVGRHTHAALDA